MFKIGVVLALLFYNLYRENDAIVKKIGRMNIPSQQDYQVKNESYIKYQKPVIRPTQY
jgi:hypothetical protein